nr:unnamed protein product [Callosobruchus chinensis]
MLLGGEIFWDLLCQGKISLGKNKPVLKETSLGWIIAGQIGGSRPDSGVSNVCLNTELNNQLQKFWEIEEWHQEKIMSDEEAYCEANFKETTYRDENGRFVVSMPLKLAPELLGESRTIAESRLRSMEKRFAKNQNLASSYLEFMAEYREMGHMSLVSSDTLERENDSSIYYTPHHAVLKEQSETTKLRVVFDASAPTSTNMSLNQIQCVGPIVQDELISIILRFRKHNVVMSADVAKMYRMIVMNPSHRGLQRILWRDSPDQDIQTYELNTVTYGQACSSFLATRCLVEISEHCKSDLPRVSNILKHDFYIDDMLTGCNSRQEAITAAKDISKKLSEYGFVLRKWQSNDQTFLSSISSDSIEHSVLNFDSNKSTKILGLTWTGQTDQLRYVIDTNELNDQNTKRAILSNIARIFDPLGLLSPCITLAKMFMQALWLEKLDWDDQVSVKMADKWNAFKADLDILNELNIPRQVLCPNSETVCLHGFADASERAYGACIYIVSGYGQHKQSRLLCAKSKLAPLKTITMPRLELCAALLLSRLYDKVLKGFHQNFNEVFLWSDSTIVLAWVKMSSNGLKVFVANRVTEIQNLTKGCTWRHVSSSENPADLLSRGLRPKEIVNRSPWWEGPKWLCDNPNTWPNSTCIVQELPELKVSVNIASTPTVEFPYNRFSNFNRLRRSVAWILRFKSNVMLPPDARASGSLSNQELLNAMKLIVRIVQKEFFHNELKQLRLKGVLEQNSNLASLSPFIDEDGLLRVGGRLKNSPYELNKKYPMLLHAEHLITKLLFEYEHYRLMHVGPNTLLSIIRENFWVLKGRNLARNTVRKCLICVRYKPIVAKLIMGNLPEERVVPSSPFTISGLDYAGPFWIKERKGRCSRHSKCYICLFICFSTKAIHLEVVSSLSTNDFILALRRFVSRRGKPKAIYSDNGTNFVGASKELGRYLVASEGNSREAASKEEIEWSFLPPHSPHFGGLWEAGVRSVKHHLKRVMNNLKLTFEEVTTMLAQIEAILNSRPLSPMSSDPNDLSVLTPGHFLIGRPLVAAPDTCLDDEKLNRLNRYQLVQQIVQHFWKRWTREFLAELQRRSKWKVTKLNLQVGDLVLIMDDGASPTEWRRGRIVGLTKGSDGIPRVVNIRTSTGVVSRNFTKLCILPVEQSVTSEVHC